MIGKSFSQYEIIEQIGQGGMGAVYRARDTRLERDVAIKVINLAMSDDPERVARFQREAKTLASMGFDNLDAYVGKTLWQSPVPSKLREKMIAEFEKIKAGF